jgi:hypothetical protein
LPPLVVERSGLLTNASDRAGEETQDVSLFEPLASLRSQAARMLHVYDVTMVQSSTAVKPHDNTIGEFLDRLRRLVIDEALTAKQNLLELWSQPLAAAVRRKVSDPKRNDSTPEDPPR